MNDASYAMLKDDIHVSWLDLWGFLALCLWLHVAGPLR